MFGFYHALNERKNGLQTAWMQNIVSIYKKGNNRPASVNQMSLVHNHDKAEYKCYTQDNTNTRENPSVGIGA